MSAPRENWKAIVAMSQNRVIGQGGMIPWHLPEDFRWFKEQTMNGILVMGRKTWESIGRALPGRKTIVVSRGNPTLPRGVELVHSLEEIEEPRKKTIWVCGGGEIYRQALPLCSELLLTLVKRKIDGDAFFPSFAEDFELVETVRERTEFEIRRYRNRWF